MIIRQLLIVYGAVLLLCRPIFAQNSFFIQMTDPQFGMFTNNVGFEQETANLEFAITSANRLHPLFVIVTGDLVNKAGDAAQIAEYLRVTHELNPAIPLYNVAGNHDVGNTPTPDSLAAYRKIFGKDYYSFRADGMEGIVLNSSIIQHPEKVMDEEMTQRAWLESELKKAFESGTKQVVVFQHIPWFLRNADEPDQYFNIPREARSRYLNILRNSGVRYVFAGHLHQNSKGTMDSLQVTTTAPVGKPLGDAASGFRTILVGPDRLCDRYYGFGDLPNQFDLITPAICNVPQSVPK